MDEAELAAQLALLLGEELADRIPDLTKVLLALERAPSDGELVRELHRLIHVVKGASRSAGMLEIEAACHALETQFADVAPGGAVPASLIASGIAFTDQLERARKALVAEPGPDDRDASLRVAADDLDLMMTHSAAVLLARQRLLDPVHALSELHGELSTRRSITPAQLASTSRRLGRVQRELASALAALGTTSGMLDENVRRLRLRSISDACQGCDRSVRDTAASVGKQAELVVRGGEVRVDRAQVDVLRDVLIQLVRNSVAHGIEAPDVRRRAGKPELGQVTIAADLVGDCVRVTVGDDGGGLDVAAVATQAGKKGMRVESLADAERAIFSPGLSTAATVSELSGRGVGLDVAKQRIEAMHGSVSVASQPGQGTTFSIVLPTTVATVTAMVVVAGDVSYAMPSSSVERAIRVDHAAVRHASGRSLVRVGDDWLPLAALASVLGSPAALPLEGRGVGLVLAGSGRRAVLLVDGIVGMLDLVAGAFDPRLGRLRHLTGQARLANGTVALVLNASDVIEDLVGMTMATPAQPVAATSRRRVLVVDDSATTRALEANILRTAGYDVVVAVDGEAALRQLRDNLQVDLIVSDVDMPNLDGFGLTQAVRGLDRIATIPIVLVTARGTDEDRAKGLRVGASAYLVKSSFDQTVLLQTIARLL